MGIWTYLSDYLSLPCFWFTPKNCEGRLAGFGGGWINILFFSFQNACVCTKQEVQKADDISEQRTCSWHKHLFWQKHWDPEFPSVNSMTLWWNHQNSVETSINTLWWRPAVSNVSLTVIVGVWKIFPSFWTWEATIRKWCNCQPHTLCVCTMCSIVCNVSLPGLDTQAGISSDGQIIPVHGNSTWVSHTHTLLYWY